MGASAAKLRYLELNDRIAESRDRAMRTRSTNTLNTAAAIAVIGALGLSACGNGHKSNGDQGPASAPPPPVSSNPPPPAQPSPCHAGDLSLSKTASDAGAGQRYGTYAFTNNGAEACTLQGYPTIVLFDANGQKLDGVTPVQTEQDYSNVGGPPTLVTIKSKGRALFYTSFTGIQATDAPCVVATRLQVTAPGNSQAQELSDELNICTGQIHISPVRSSVIHTGGGAAASHTKNNNPNSTVFY
jgi:hypothetical protein